MSGHTEGVLLSYQVVAHNHHSRLALELVCSLPDNLDVPLRVAQHVRWQPSCSLFPPIATQRRWAHHQEGEVFRELGTESEGLRCLPQAHLVGQQDSAPAAQCEVDCFTLVWQHLVPLPAGCSVGQHLSLDIGQEHVGHLLCDPDLPETAEIWHCGENPRRWLFDLRRPDQLEQPLEDLGVPLGFEDEPLRPGLGARPLAQGGIGLRRKPLGCPEAEALTTQQFHLEAPVKLPKSLIQGLRLRGTARPRGLWGTEVTCTRRRLLPGLLHW
mmetsp:Transcript_24180/g.56054  ORF Transcript_24180/g.56054 Transcript_24180/m.56054 type:complete len:270 (-) Transcript_24180:21-830(-)